MTLLEAKHVSKVYRQTWAAETYALNDVSVTVPADSFTVLTGPSGSGKTTLLALLGCMERPTTGQVIFAGQELQGCSDAEMARVRRRIGFVFQDFALIPGLAAWENITIPLVPRGVSRQERYKLARLMLSQLGLENKAASKPPELSGGEQQRVAFGRALAGNPEIILADEPTSNLDEEAAETVVSLLKEAQSKGLTIIASSHDPRLVGLASHTCMLKKGRIADAKKG